MLDSQATFAPFLDEATLGAAPALQDSPAASAPPAAVALHDPVDARPVTPRRPLRFSFARTAEDVAPVTLPVANLFAGVFDEDDLTTAGVDPRLARSRQRARAILAAREATLPAEEANLWHDFALDDPKDAAPAAAQITPDLDAASAPRSPRRVRRLTCADLITLHPTDAPAQDPVQDPLQDHLHRIREALYAPDPEGDAAAAHPGLSTRLATHALNIALVATALPIGAAMMIYTFARGEDLRLSARMVAVAGTAITLLQLGVERFV